MYAEGLSDMGRTKKAKPASAKLCEVSGHDWIKTTCDTVEVCSRKTCGQVRQKIKGHWRFVRKFTGKNKKDVFKTVELWEDVLA